MTYTNGQDSDCFFRVPCGLKWPYSHQNMRSNEEAEDRQRKEGDDSCQNLDRVFEMSIYW